MHNINFYDRSLRIQRDWVSARNAAMTVGAVVAAIGVVFLALFVQVQSLRTPAALYATALVERQQLLAELTLQLGQTRPNEVLEHKLLALQATLDARRAALDTLGREDLGRAHGYAALLEALARQSVEGLWLTGVTMEAGDMALRGRTVRPELIATYVGRLNGESALQGHAFRALDVRRPVDEPAAGAAPTSSGTTPAPLRLTPYVEFALVGAGGTGAVSATGAASAAAATGARVAQVEGRR